MYKKSHTELTDTERIRLDEIVFYDYIQDVFQNNPNPVKVFDFVEVLCSLTRCNMLIMNSIVIEMMNGGNHFIPTKLERIYLMSKSSLGVRDICRRLDITQRTYYKYVEKTPPYITCRLTTEQHEELLRFFKNLKRIVPERM